MPGRDLHRDAEEHDLVVRKVSLNELEQLIGENVIKDAQTMAAWSLYLTRNPPTGKPA